MKLSIREQQIYSHAAELSPKTRMEQLLAEDGTFRRVTTQELAVGGPNEAEDGGDDDPSAPPK